MAYIVSKGLPEPTSLRCPDCKNNRFTVTYSKVSCNNCGWTEKRGSNKYGAVRTEARDGQKRDSKYEASVADELLMRKRAGDIKDYDSQFKVEMWAYDENGKKAMKVSHKIDFRIHNNDGSYELLEAKGKETPDWRMRVRWLEAFWLPLHPDHTYRVVKQG